MKVANATQEQMMMTRKATPEEVKLAEAGLERDKINELTLSLAFSITCMIDGISGIEADGMNVQPYLTFQVDDELVHCGENSFMHELIYDVIGRLLGD